MSTPGEKNGEETDEKDTRSPLAIGYEWSVIVSSIGLEMALPPAFGIWLDQKCGTVMLFTVLGAILGMTTAMMHLIQITKNK